MEADILKVALYPLVISEEPEKNLRSVAQVMKSLAPGTDIFVLPEMFSTGFYLKKENIPGLAQTMNGSTMTALKSLASEHQCCMAGSFLCEDSGRYYNRAFFITPEGEVHHYDKRHLFSPGFESSILSGGSAKSPVITYKGWKIAMSVCYDLRFPVWTRRHEGFSYDVMIVPANWPSSRGYAWHHLLIARAIENQAAWVGCDCGGSDKYGDYDGMSQVYDATGHPIGRMDEANGIMYADIDRAVTEKYRSKLPTHIDQDSFSILM